MRVLAFEMLDGSRSGTTSRSRTGRSELMYKSIVASALGTECGQRRSASCRLLAWYDKRCGPIDDIGRTSIGPGRHLVSQAPSAISAKCMAIQSCIWAPTMRMEESR